MSRSEVNVRSTKAARRVLWATLLVTLPLPYFMVEIEIAPALRLFLLAATCAAAAIAEPGPDTGSIAGLLVGQAAAAAALTYVAARVVTRGIARLDSRRARILALGVLVGLLFAAALFPVFRTPLSSRAPRANLFGIFQ